MDLNNKEEILKAMSTAIETYDKKNMVVDVMVWSAIKGAINKRLTDK